jgi:ER-bound oxygenase mpaB/B'/Rubber oxygenase, catalytic domain
MFKQRITPPEITALDPIRDHLKIVQWVGEYEFPFETQRSLEFALFRTFAVPSISGLLANTGHFAAHGQKRYDDTTLIIAEIAENGYDSQRGRDAIRRMNQIHHHFAISNDDYLYVLSTFVFEPSRFGRLLSWREATDNEKLANYIFWREIGRRMNIQNIPDTIRAFEQFNHDYERDHFRYAESNHQVAESSVQVFLEWYPALLRPLARKSIYALMDDALLDAVGFPKPSRWWRGLVRKTLRLRAAIIKWMPRRRKPFLLTRSAIRTYPSGYKMDDLGPEGH